MNESDREALINFSPLGPYFLYKERHLTKMWALALYAAQITSILLFTVYTKFDRLDLIGSTLLCSGFLGLSVTPKVERLIQLRSGKAVSNKVARLVFSSLAFLCALLFLIQVIYSNDNKYILIFSIAITLLFFIFELKVLFKN